jgi:DNA modification methylase
MDSVNKLILGDNLEILRGIESETVDLIYLDPPFFSNRNYEVIWGDEGEVRSFQDRWSGGMDHYIGWLKERVIEMHRILKPTGSIFLHCDWHANAYIRVDILDKIFGYTNFRGDIAWQRHNAHNDAKKKLAVLKDSIFYYSKNGQYNYKPVYVELSEDYKELFYRFEDEKGTYRLSDLTGPKVNPNDTEWRGFHPSKSGRSWSISKEAVANIAGAKKALKLSISEKLDLLYDNNLIYISGNGIPSFKRYLDNSKGNLLGDVWTDIKNVSSNSKEKIGYPTQKPFTLMQRIIEMASNEGDVVLDPFMGGGTTVAVADKLNRKWIGIDQSVQAVKVTEFRLNQQQDLFSKPFLVNLHKYDYDTLRYQDAFAFEQFIVTQYGGTPNKKQRSDMGMDGKAKDGAGIQVKRSDDIGRNVVDNFLSAVQRADKKLFDKLLAAKQPVGYIIAFSFGKGAVQEVARLKNQDNIIITLVKVEDIIPIAQKPSLTVEIRETTRDKKNVCEMELIARGNSAAGVEFYSWDFGYQADKGFKPEVIIDKEGIQTYKFKPGMHHIAIKVVDNDGLDNIEVIKLKVNGTVERE